MDLLKPLGKSEFPAQTAAIGAAATNTADWIAGPQAVRVWSDQPCYVEVGEGAVATSSSTPIPANSPIVIAVPSGTGAPWRVSVIQVSVAGTVYCKPVNKE